VSGVVAPSGTANDAVRFTRLLSPGRIGSLELRNRVVLPAMDMNLCDNGSVTAAEVDHYAARARGGTGLVITGTGAVAWPHGAASMHQPAFSDDAYIPGMARLAEAVHAEGGRVAMQLCHHGKVSTVDMAAGRPVLVPSVPVPAMDLSTLTECSPDELMALATASGGRAPQYQEATEEDLAWVVQAFADAARRVVAAGIDAIEVHAAHGYLLSTFLSPGYNRRDDAWGGDEERRCRLACEVLAAIRAVVGPGYPVMIRINGVEFGPHGGLDPAGAAGVAVRLAAAGADAIHVSANAHDPFVNFTDGPVPNTVGAYRHAVTEVKQALVAAGHDVAVVGVGRVLPGVAEDMLARGDCDFVSMGRQLLADPDLPNHLRQGGTAAVRPCINCYVCVEQNFFDGTPRCAVNARLGRGELAALPAVAAARRVVVVGGGPAGLEAARVAASRGHVVTILEAAGTVGGTARFSALTTPDNAPLVDWLAREVANAGVEVRCGVRADTDTVKELRPEVVVVATGARRPRPAVAPLAGTRRPPRVHGGDDLRALLSGDGRAHTVSRASRVVVGAARRLGMLGHPAALRRLSRVWLPLGRRVVVVGGGLVGLELAVFLAERGRQVTIVDDGDQLGLPMALPRRWRAVAHAAEEGVRVHRGATVAGLLDAAVRLSVAAPGDGAQRSVDVPADDVVVASGVEADTSRADALGTALVGTGVEVHVVGDASGVGYIEGAVRSGFDVAAAL
jgi:2,4-dienoyl-CoA reductase-like NADH-dependent reductase (Old Yellow Enzyme family)/NADPH-dependent 2,4-dienoyl-CoA reductase/sulfur reductase-like enzyme